MNDHGTNAEEGSRKDDLPHSLLVDHSHANKGSASAAVEVSEVGAASVVAPRQSSTPTTTKLSP